MLTFSEEILNGYQLQSYFTYMKVRLMKLRAKNFIQMKDNTGWHNKQKCGKL
jgi:hypothetical protein